MPEWSGAAYGADSFWLWGGGHSDYGGNEVYRYDLRAGAWQRYGPWLTHDVDDSGCLDPRNAPISSHSADGLWWAHGQLWVAGYSGYCRGEGTQQAVHSTWSFSPESGTWTPYRALEGVEPHTALDPVNDLVYHWSRRYRRDIYDGRTLKVLARSDGPIDYVSDYTNLEVDTRRKVVYGHTNDRLYAWPVDARGHWTGEQQVYEGMPSATAGMAMRNGKLYFWSGGNTVRQFDPSNATWERYTATDAPRREYHRIFSKWQYAPELDAFLGFSEFHALYLWKPPPDSGRTSTALDGTANPPAPGEASPRDGVARTPAASASPPVPVTRHHDERRGPGGVEWAHDPFAYGGLPPFDPSADKPTRPPVDRGTIGLDPGMRNTGDRPSIGLVTAWQAALLAGHSEYLDVVVAQASEAVGRKLRWEWEHTYPLYWVPFLLTGDARYLDEKRKLWHTYQVTYRQRPVGGPMEPLTEREFTWQLRNLAQLATADPENYGPILEKTRRYVVRHYMERARPGRQVLHNVGPERRDRWSNPQRLGMSFWQQAFVGQVLAHVVMLGHEEWRHILNHHFELWRKFGARKVKHIDNGDVFYWSATDGDRATWEAIISAYEGSGELRNQPDGALFRGHDVGTRHIRAQQAVNAVAMAALAGLDDARELHRKLRDLVEARARSTGLPMTVRDAVLVP